MQSSRSLVLALTLGSVFAFGAVTQAGLIANSTMLTEAHEKQIEAWLGQGDIQLTNIFSKTAGDGLTSIDFHAAADGKGATLSIFEVQGILVGAYNPYSWNSVGDYRYTPDDTQRTAFLFNLTDSTVLRQLLGTYAGQYTTFGYQPYGPTFGGGHDLYVGPSLENGHAYAYSYSPQGSTNIFGAANVGSYSEGSYFDYGVPISKIEVFTFAPAQVASATPEPTSALFGLALLGTVAMGRYRARKIA